MRRHIKDDIEKIGKKKECVYEQSEVAIDVYEIKCEEQVNPATSANGDKTELYSFDLSLSGNNSAIQQYMIINSPVHNY